MNLLRRYTLLRHTLLALVGFGLLYAFIQLLSDAHNDAWIQQSAPIVCATAGLTVLVGQSGQISLGHGAFMLTGAYTTALLLEHWQTSHGSLQLIPVIAAAAAVSALFGGVVGIAAARLRGPYLAGATLALAVGLPQVPDYHSFSSTLGGNRGISVIPANPPSGWDPYKWQSVVFGIAVIVVLWVLANVSSSRIGRSFRAVRDDEIAASLAGLSVARTQVLAFVVSAACAGVGGALLALYNLDAGVAAFPLSLSLSLLAAAVFGGLGRLTGSVLGAVIVTLLPNWSQSLTNALSVHSAKIAPNLPLLIYGVVLAVAMLAVPDGLQGGLMRLRRLLLTRRR